MAFAGLIVSLGILFVTWLIVTMAECGLTIGMILMYPFTPLIEKFVAISDKRTEEEKMAELEQTLRIYKPARSYDEIKKEAIDKFFH